MYTVSELVEVNNSLADRLNRQRQEERRVPELDEYYRGLFGRIASDCSQASEGWFYCLMPGELVLLCNYICSEESEVNRNNLIKIFSQTKLFNYVDILYSGWQDNYTNEGFQGLFVVIKNNLKLNKVFAEKYKLKAADILNNLSENHITEYIVSCAGTECNGTYDSFCEELEAFGLRTASKIYEDCKRKFALVCNAKAYMNMGADVVESFMKDLSEEEMISLIKNMLIVLDGYQLRGFVQLAPKIVTFIGDNNSKMYQKTIAQLSPKSCKNYMIWQNQYLIYEVLGDGPRAAFWMNYLDKGVLNKNEKLSVLLLEFPSFTVIEFRSFDAAYFFNNTYMKELVGNGIASAEDEQELENWLHDNTEWSSDIEHKDHWRKAHVGNWQLDMKTYMSRHLRNNAG